MPYGHDGGMDIATRKAVLELLPNGLITEILAMQYSTVETLSHVQVRRPSPFFFQNYSAQTASFSPNAALAGVQARFRYN